MAKVANVGFLSTNTGTSWTALNTASLPAGALAILPPWEQISFLALASLGYIVLQTTGKTGPSQIQDWKNSQLLHLPRQKIPLLLAQHYLYASSLPGMNWIHSLIGQSFVTAVDTVIYATSVNSGVCYSSNDGKTWTTPLNIGAPTQYLPLLLSTAITFFLERMTRSVIWVCPLVVYIFPRTMLQAGK